MRQPITIDGHLFQPAREQMNETIDNTIAEMIRCGFEEGTVNLKLHIKLDSVIVGLSEQKIPTIEYEVGNSMKRAAKEKGKLKTNNMCIRETNGFECAFELVDGSGQMEMEGAYGTFEEG